MNERAWSGAGYGYGAISALGLAYFLVRMPYQVSDHLEHLLILQFQSFGELLTNRLTGPGSVRPVMWLQQKVLFDAAPAGHYFLTYKAFHVAQLLAVVILFVRLLRVRTVIDFATLPLTLAVLVGVHTFNVTMREGYPVNHFMTILVCCLLVVNLAMSRASWWRDAAAVLVFAYAALTIETGLLVWVCMVAAYVAGWRGVSLKALVVATVVLAAYVVLRLSVLDVGTRTLTSMSSGYGFSVRGTDELVELFGDAPWKFYLYNVACAALTVLFSEPRAGVFQFSAFVARGDVPLWSVVNVVVSAIATVLIGVYAARRMRHWRRGPLEHEDGVLLLFLAVLAANAVISYPYLKEVVMSPAGMFYAAALFFATRDLLRRLSLRRTGAAAALLVIPLAILSAGWTLRAVTLVASMRATAFVNRSDWAVADQFENRNRPQWRSRHPQAETLLRRLREEVIRTPVPQPYTVPRWTREWLDPY
jgi:hypothetical protein